MAFFELNMLISVYDTVLVTVNVNSFFFLKFSSIYISTNEVI